MADLWHMHLRGEETSMNPLGMVVALLGAMDHAAVLHPESQTEVTKRLGSRQQLNIRINILISL